MNTLIVLGSGGVAVLLADLLWEGEEVLLRVLALAALAGALLVAPGIAPRQLLADPLGRVLADVAIVAAAAAVLPRWPAAWRERAAAYLALVLWSAAGMVLLAEAANFLTLFLGLELLSLGLYALTAWGLDARGGEAAFKYFMLGGLASGLLLFGGALSYAATGSLTLAAWHSAGGVGPALVIAGLAFELALVPLHVWSPDVYRGAPPAVTAFMSVGAKAAAYAALVRVAGSADIGLVVALGVASMFLGYLLAVPQRSLLRLLAYSGIAHAGTLVLALAAGPAGLPAALLYVPAYGAATAGVFIVARSVGDGMDRYAGLARRAPWLAAACGACILALASVPPTGVFFAKLLLLVGLVQSGRADLAVLIVVATVVALYPYFKVVALLVGAPAPDVERPRLDTGAAVVLGAAAVMSLAIGIAPGLILR